MTRPPRRDQPTEQETAELVASLRQAVATAQVHPVTEPRFGRHGGVLHNTDRTRHVEVVISGSTTRLSVAETATGLQVDDWSEPTADLLARLTTSGVDYDAVVGVG